MLLVNNLSFERNSKIVFQNVNLSLPPKTIIQVTGRNGSGKTTLLKLFEKVPTIKAIKDWCNEPMLHEKHIRVFQNLPNPVNVLTTHSAWLMSSLVMGANGLLSGAGSVIAPLQVRLFNAVKNNNLEEAKDINDKIFPLVQLFYKPPFLDMHNRMKETLVILNAMKKAVVRPPLMKLPFEEIEELKNTVNDVNLDNKLNFVKLVV